MWIRFLVSWTSDQVCMHLLSQNNEKCFFVFGIIDNHPSMMEIRVSLDCPTDFEINNSRLMKQVVMHEQWCRVISSHMQIKSKSYEEVHDGWRCVADLVSCKPSVWLAQNNSRYIFSCCNIFTAGVLVNTLIYACSTVSQICLDA